MTVNVSTKPDAIFDVKQQPKKVVRVGPGIIKGTFDGFDSWIFRQHDIRSRFMNAVDKASDPPYKGAKVNLAFDFTTPVAAAVSDRVPPGGFLVQSSDVEKYGRVQNPKCGPCEKYGLVCKRRMQWKMCQHYMWTQSRCTKGKPTHLVQAGQMTGYLTRHRLS